MIPTYTFGNVGPYQGLNGTHKEKWRDNMENQNNGMRLPEEGTPTGAGPGTGFNASDQRPRNSRRLGRGHPEIQLAEQRSRITSESPPAEGAALNTGELTQAGLPRRRIKWTYDMNVSVIRAFFKATRDGAETLHYRQQMRHFFLLDYPNLGHISQQNLSDRKRAIERRNLIPSIIIEQIRREVQNEHAQQPALGSSVSDMPSGVTQPETDNALGTNPIATSHRSDTQGQNSGNINTDGQELLTTIVQTFNTAKAQFTGMCPENRPYLPKPVINRQIHQVINLLNTAILPAEITPDIQFQHIMDLLYCSAYTIVTIQNRPKHNERQVYQNRTGNAFRARVSKPHWQIRLERKINNIRKDLGYLTSYKNNKVSMRRRNKFNMVKKRHLIHTGHEQRNETIDQVIDTVKQKLKKIVDKYRRYTKSYNRKSHNYKFSDNEKRFYNMLKNPDDKNDIVDTNKLPMTEMEKFWTNIWSTNSEHNKQASWLAAIEASVTDINGMTNEKISNEVFERVISRLHNWKQPGPDKIHNFYYKYLRSIHLPLLKIFNNFLDNPHLIPNSMCRGITYLKPKENMPTSPSQFRPITCLNTGYKLFTACLTNIITNHCESNKIISIQQKGSSAGTKGCKDQLIIDSIIVNQAIRDRRNMYAAFIDYQKAFDSIPHSWLIEILSIYKIHAKVVNCVKTLTETWATQLSVKTLEGNLKSGEIKIKRGIYQGDSLSPLLFCLALNPLSYLLNTSKYGYRLRSPNGEYKVSHSLYMDDLKLYSGTKESLQRLLGTVEIFTKDVGMKFGIAKCRTQNIHRGKFTCGDNYTTSDKEVITPLNRGEYYKYLGVQQSLRIEHSVQKKTLTTEFTRRMRQICRMGLNGLNITRAINTYAIPLLTYSFGIISWSRTDLNALDCKVRTILTKYNYHHPKSALERINLPRNRGGRGILSIAILHDRQINSLKKYFTTMARTNTMYNTLKSVDDNLTPLNLNNEELLQMTTMNDLEATWKSKVIHGRYPNEISREYIDIHSTHSWLRYGTLFPETEGHIVAIQDGVIGTRNYMKYIAKDRNTSTDVCRMCGNAQETITHITNGCRTLAATHYKSRHDAMGKIIHMEIAKRYNLMVTDPPYYKYQPQSILENGLVTIYWDRSILMDVTDNGTPAPNRPDMILISKMDKTAFIIDFANPLDANILDTIETKIRKYQHLSQFLKRTWKLDTVQVLPVVISSTGTIPKRTVTSIQYLGLKDEILVRMQKAVLIRTSSIVREVMG